MQLFYLAVRYAAGGGTNLSKVLPRFVVRTLEAPLVALLSCTLGLVGWVVWLVYAEKARANTRSIVDAFGLELKHEPWPMWSPIPVSIAWLPLLVALLYASYWRLRLERACLDGCSAAAAPAPGENFPGGPSAIKAYFVRVGLCNSAAWLVKVLVVSLLVAYGAWAAAAAALHACAAKATRPFIAQAADRALLTSSSEAGPGQGTYSAAAAAGGDDGAPHWASWGPDWPGPPGHRCPPTCVDLSGLHIFGDDACACDTIGGMFASVQLSKEAACHLVCAMVGLGLMYCAVSWLVVAVACQLAHTQSELLYGSSVTELAQLQSRALGDWLLRALGRAHVAAAGDGDAGTRQGLLTGSGEPA